MRLAPTQRFFDALNDLDRESQYQIKKAMQKMLQAPPPRGLRMKKMQGHPNVWECSPNMDLRITYEIVEDTYVLRNCGHHDPTLRNP